MIFLKGKVTLKRAKHGLARTAFPKLKRSIHFSQPRAVASGPACPVRPGLPVVHSGHTAVRAATQRS